MANKTRLKLISSGVMLALAGLFITLHLTRDTGLSEQAFYYDLSEKKLFAGPRGGIPPLRGSNDAVEDAVRAVVISTNNRPRDPKSWTISYLEMYSPELKRQMEEARATGTSPRMGRGLAQMNKWVKRPADADWVPVSSPQGLEIVNAWLTAGPGGGQAAVCSP